MATVAAEGITRSGVGGYVSLTEIEVLDLISEGLISGLVNGEYQYSGRAYQTGWDVANFSGYQNASGTTVNFLRSVFWNEVPAVNSENKYNFQSINVKATPGRPNGSNTSERIRDELTVTRTISERLRFGSDFAKIYRIFNKDCQAVRVNIRFGQLSNTVSSGTNYGDIEATTVNYNIYYRPIFNNVHPTQFQLGIEEEVTGNISQGYIRASYIPLLLNDDDFQNKDAFIGWEIKIERTTEDATTSFIRNQTSIDSLTEIYGNTFVYPNSAIVSSRFSAEYFSQIPSRAYDTYGLLVNVPANYDPIKKIYKTTGPGTNGDGSWDGTFAANKQWTDNPAWCWYDILTNARYGLGKYIDSTQVDKWTLYEIAQYCDVLVPDGFGNLEPRFSCNLLIHTREDAYQVINDMASIFNAITYYAGGNIYLSQDKKHDTQNQSDVFTLFTNANVENGDFNYASSSRRVRHTVAIIRYNDKTNFYKPAVEYVEDIEGIKRYGIRELEVTAFGCTSRGQALRLGRWALLSETLQTETINFVGGLEASTLRPGDLFKVFDFNRRNRRFGGRTNKIQLLTNTINQVTGQKITLDANLTGFNVGKVYQFTLLTPTYTLDPAVVNITTSNDIIDIRKSQLQTLYFSGNQTGTVSGKTTVLMTSGFCNLQNTLTTGNYNITGNLIWSIEASGATGEYIDSNESKFYRTINIQEDQGYKFKVAGLEYNDDKYSQIESGLAFQQPGYDGIPPNPTNLSLQLRNPAPSPNTQVIDYSFTMPNVTGVSNYYVYAKIDSLSDNDITGSNQNLINILPASTKSGAYIPLTEGNYFFRVYSVNRVGTKSNGYANNSINVTNINPLADVIISSLDLYTGIVSNAAGTKITGEYSSSEPTFRWQMGFAQGLNAPTDITYRLTVREPSINNFPAANIYFEKTGLVPNVPSNPTYQFLMDDNILADGSVDGKIGPFRNYDVVVEGMTAAGNSSAGGNFITNSDSNFSNINGYDILYVENPQITGIDLTTGNNLPNPAYVTEQWSSLEGNIFVNLISGSLPSDTAGGYIYYSTIPFDKNDVVNFVQDQPNPKTIKKVKWLGTPNPIITAPSFQEEKGYIALSVFDSFDQAVEDRGKNILKDLYISNTAQILQRQGTSETALGFKSWVTIVFSPNFSWDSTQQGIKSVSLLGTAQANYGLLPYYNPLPITYDGLRVRFTTALKNANYSIVLLPNCESLAYDSKNGLFLYNIYPEIFIPNKTTTYFDIGIKGWNKVLRAGDASNSQQNPLTKLTTLSDVQRTDSIDMTKRSFTIGILYNGY